MSKNKYILLVALIGVIALGIIGFLYSRGYFDLEIQETINSEEVKEIPGSVRISNEEINYNEEVKKPEADPKSINYTTQELEEQINALDSLEEEVLINNDFE